MRALGGVTSPVLRILRPGLAAAIARLQVGIARLRRSELFRLKLLIVLATFGGLAVVLLLIATKPIFLGFDSINNYVHVWFISNSLYGSGSIPLRDPWLDNGQALTYPYAWLPWTLAALVRPIVGDYAVTWTMLVGFVLTAFVVYKTRLGSDHWLLALFLLYPVQLNGLLSFQMAFVWASLFGYLYIRAVEKQDKWQALLWYTLAATTHLTIMVPILTAYNVVTFASRKDRRGPVLYAVVPSLPVVGAVAWYSLQAPSVGANSTVFLFFAILETAVTRSTLFFLPFLLVKFKKVLSGRKVGVAIASSMMVISIATALPFGALQGLVTQANDPYIAFLSSDAFRPGAHYRLLEASDREQGHYFLVQHGAVLSQELFSESQVRRNWTPKTYRCFLSAKGIDYVIINRGYNQMFRTNEEKLLEEMVLQGESQRAYVDPVNGFNVYDVSGVRLASPMPVRRCFGR